METMIAIGALVVVIGALLIAMNRKPRNPDRDYAIAIFKEVHKAWYAGRKFGAVEQRVGDLEHQWDGGKMPVPVKDDVPYEGEDDDRGPLPMPDGTDPVAEVTDAPLRS